MQNHSHWRGMEFVEAAAIYVVALKKENEKAERKGTMPLDRLEPATVMVDFIRSLTTGKPRVAGDLYLGATKDDGDNSDNGHHVINVVDLTVT